MRKGFTLIELMVVIVIIAILAALVATGVGGAITLARISATKATLLKVDKQINEILDQVNREYETALAIASKQGLSVGHPNPWIKKAAVKQAHLSNYIRCSNRLALTIVLKEERMRIFFGSNLYPLSLGRSAHLEIPKRFYLALIQRASEDLFSDSEVATDGDGRRYLVDAWGNPIRFYLYPTRLVRPGGTPGYPMAPSPFNESLARLLLPNLGPQPPTPPPTLSNPNPVPPPHPLEVDPDDPQGEFATILLLAQTVPNSPRASQFRERFFHGAFCWHAPLVVSAGPDGVLGLHESHEFNQFGHLAMPNVDSNGDGFQDWTLSDPNHGPLNDNLSNFTR